MSAGSFTCQASFPLLHLPPSIATVHDRRVLLAASMATQIRPEQTPSEVAGKCDTQVTIIDPNITYWSAFGSQLPRPSPPLSLKSP